MLSQAGFLLAGLTALTILAGGDPSAKWLGTITLAFVVTGGFFLAQRLGLLRLLEMLVERIAAQFPALAGMSLAGLHEAAQGFYSRGRALLHATLLHFVAWSLGTIETWIILHGSVSAN